MNTVHSLIFFVPVSASVCLTLSYHILAEVRMITWKENNQNVEVKKHTAIIVVFLSLTLSDSVFWFVIVVIIFELV